MLGAKGIQNSMNSPQKIRPPLNPGQFQVVVIGGGINGAAIARECARAQRRTLLLEQNDLAAGTTSRSTRIIHGGLRYLEHGEIGLVRESLRERRRLLKERSHLVKPVQFLLPLGKNSRRSALKVRFGLWLYRQFAGRTQSSADTALDRNRLERLLDSHQHWSIFSFEDAQCEFPERLVAEWLVEAAAWGAVVRNHTKVLAIDVAHGRAKGVLARDLLTGKEQRIHSDWVINATGPWADRMCQRSSIDTHGPMIGGVRGSHIVLPRFPGAPNSPVFTEAVDGRPIFVLPWHDQILVGTTEIPDHGDPGIVQPSGEEIEYLLDSVNAVLPGVRQSISDIRYAFAGVRPLPFSEASPSTITRRHFLRNHRTEGVERVISIIGGKLTTAAELARECAREIGIQVPETDTVRAIDGDLATTHFDDFIAEVAGIPGFSEKAAEAIAEWHGRRTIEILRLARSCAEMRAALCPHTDHIVAEAVDAYRNEFAVTLGDVLLRRVPVALGSCWSEQCSRVAANRIAATMGWNQAETKIEWEAFEAERSAFLSKPRPLTTG